MRNLSVYPITPDEVTRTLWHLFEKIRDEELIGDSRPLILSGLIDIIEENPELVEKMKKFGY